MDQHHYPFAPLRAHLLIIIIPSPLVGTASGVPYNQDCDLISTNAIIHSFTIVSAQLVIVLRTPLMALLVRENKFTPK